MKQDENGFSTIELIVSLSVIALIGLAATMTIFQVINVIESSNNHITVVRQVQNAGYWISRDAQMTVNVTTENLSPTEFMLLTWTVWDESDNATNHLVTYFFEELSDGIGRLKRNHWSSAGLDQNTLVAEYISYDPGDPVNTSNVSYQEPVLTVKLTSLFANARETMEYKISFRPKL